MKRKRLLAFMGAVLAILLGVMPVFAGQVVTEREKTWARQALAQEAALSGGTMPTNTLSVLYFDNPTGVVALDVLRKGLAFMLMTDLAKVENLRVVERVRLQALLDEMRLGSSGLVAPETASRLGRILGARFLVGGGLVEGGGPDGKMDDLDDAAITRILESSIRVNPGVMDVPGRQKQDLPAMEGRVNQIIELEKRLLFAYVEYLQLSLSEAEKAALGKPMTTNPRALFYFFMGLYYSDMGRYDQAGRCYEKSLQLDAGLTPALDALQELRQLSLYGAPKKSMSVLKSVRDRTSLTNSLSPAEAVKRVRTPAEVEVRQRRDQMRNTDPDNDGDGYRASVDCNDNDSSIHPGATEIPDDGIDQNCDGIDLICDVDGDGFASQACGGNDCNDNDSSIYPGAPEECEDGIDSNCNGFDCS